MYNHTIFLHECGIYQICTYKIKIQGSVAVCNTIIVQLSRIMSVLLTGNVWSVLPCVMCGDDYAIISWRKLMVERSAVRRREINTPLPPNVALDCKYSGRMIM